MTLNQHKPLIIIILSLIFAGLFAFTANAYAAKSKSGPPWYEIEVIIFLNQLELGVASENWQVDGPPGSNNTPLRLGLPGDINPNIELTGFGTDAGNTNRADPSQQMDNPANHAFVLLERDQFQLTNIYNKLTNSANYKPLLHIAWRQPTLSPSKSQPIYVFNSMDQIQADPVPQPTTRNQFSEPAVFGATTTENVSGFFEGPQIQQFSGTIRVSVARYLHIETDLHYRSPIWLQETVEVVEGNSDSSISSFFGVQPSNTTNMVVEREVLIDFRMLETRRMRSREIHYYDHPKFSMIVMATPYAADADS